MKKIAAIIFASVFLTLLFAELYFRATYNKHSTQMNGTVANSRWREPYIEFGDFKTGVQGIENPENYGYYKENSIYVYKPRNEIRSVTERGEFLYSERKMEALDPKEKRIFVMGGSAALGDGTTNANDRFWLQLERKVQKLCGGAKIHVISAAVRSFITTQERISLELYVLPLKPDAIIFFHGFNDLAQMESLARPGDPYNQGIAYARSESFGYQTIQWLSSLSKMVDFYAFHYLNKTIYDEKWRMAQNPGWVNKYSSEIASVLLDNVQKMAKRCQQEKIPCYFIQQPAKLDASTKSFLFWDAYRKIEKVYGNDKAFANGSKAINLAPKYFSQPTLFADVVHMNGAGQNLVTDDVIALLASDKNILCPKSTH